MILNLFLILWAVSVFFLLYVLYRKKQALEKIIRSIEGFSPGQPQIELIVKDESEVGELANVLNKIFKQLRKVFKEIENEKMEINKIISSMIEQVLVINLSGEIVLVNPAALKLFGFNPEQVLRKRFVEVVRQASLIELVQQVLKSLESQTRQFSLILESEKTFQAQAVPVFHSHQISGVLIVLHDITEIKKLERVRKDFVANVSHELRTPLTSIQGFAETLLDGGLEDVENNREFVQTIYNQAERLTSLVNQLLDLSVIEAGSKPMQLEFFSMSEILNECVQLFQSQIKQSKIDVLLKFSESLPLINANRTQIKQVFINLIDNALKFNKKGGFVHISVEWIDQTIQVKIADSGSGIPSGDLDKIFERFYRVDKARSREVGGTGLGLSIVKHILDQHKAKIQVQSVVGEGSVFEFIFQLNPF